MAMPHYSTAHCGWVCTTAVNAIRGSSKKEECRPPGRTVPAPLVSLECEYFTKFLCRISPLPQRNRPRVSANTPKFLTAPRGVGSGPQTIKETTMTARKFMKATALGATLLTSALAAAIGNAASGADWLGEQIGLSDGSSYFAGEGISQQGPEGRPAVAQGSERDSFLETQLAMSDGAPHAVEYGGSAGPEGKRAQSNPDYKAAFVQRQLRITDGSPE
jgi:hypothetical protein